MSSPSLLGLAGTLRHCYASRFLQTEQGDPRAESFTHADGIVGHFEITPGERGDATLSPNAKQFVAIEAKLGSALSVGTRNAPTYDQAARNVACIAHLIGRSGLAPSKLERVGLYVIAPSAQIEAGVFSNLVTRESIEQKVRERLAPYSGIHDAWFRDTLIPLLDRIKLGLLSWEKVQAIPPSAEKKDGGLLWEMPTMEPLERKECSLTTGSRLPPTAALRLLSRALEPDVRRVQSRR